MMLRVFALFWFLLNTHVAIAQDWRLIDANEMTPGRYLILTVPLDEPDALAAVAASLAEDFGVPVAAEWPLASISVHCLVYDARAVDDVDALIEAMRNDDRVRTAQRVLRFTAFEVPYTDPLFPLQWPLRRMNVVDVHKMTRGEGVRIGIVDSAIDVNHPDLSGQVVDARDFVTGPSGRVAEEHGTAMAGIIAAKATNEGIVGIAPNSQLVGLRACWQAAGAPGKCNSFSLARAINFAILNDIAVLNLSLGGPADQLLAELIEAAVVDGMFIVAAAGESAELDYPASLEGVVAAGASDLPGRIPAPVQDVISTAPGGTHRYVSGSSVATAHVSGVAALLLSMDPKPTNLDVAALLSGAVRIVNETMVLDACKAFARLDVACSN